MIVYIISRHLSRCTLSHLQRILWSLVLHERSLLRFRAYLDAQRLRSSMGCTDSSSLTASFTMLH